MIRVAVLGAGLIGLDLVHRISRSTVLDCLLVVGRRRTTGLHRAAEAGCPTEVGGPERIAEHAECLDLVFDASDAAGHVQLMEALGGRGPRIVDLTPSHLGVPVVPTVNPEQALLARDISLISCAGQATIPVLHAVSQEFPPSYIEIVTTAASVTAGPATRRNLDEFLACTGSAIAAFTGSPQVKVLANISPAKPEPSFRLVMRLQAQGMDLRRVQALVEGAAQSVRTNAPGYAVTSCSLSGDVATVTAEVTSTGDWIPRYAGNLEIISAAAVAVATTLATPATVPDPPDVAEPVAEGTHR